MIIVLKPFLIVLIILLVIIFILHHYVAYAMDISIGKLFSFLFHFAEMMSPFIIIFSTKIVIELFIFKDKNLVLTIILRLY